MPDFIAQNALLVLVVSLVGVLACWVAADHFRTYVLDGSTDPIKTTSLRYFQLFSGLLAIAALGLVLGIGAIVFPGGRLIVPQATATPTLSSVNAEGTILPETALTPAASPTSAPPAAEATQAPAPSATPARTAVIGNTGGAGANMRTIPSTTGTIVTSVNDGNEVILLDQTQIAEGFTWQLIALEDGRSGWVVSNFLIFNP